MVPLFLPFPIAVATPAPLRSAPPHATPHAAPAPPLIASPFPHNNNAIAEEEAVITVTAALSANTKIKNLHAAKQDLEENLAVTERPNKGLAMETHRLEGVFFQVQDDVTTAQNAAILAEHKVATLEAEVNNL